MQKRFEEAKQQSETVDFGEILMFFVRWGTDPVAIGPKKWFTVKYKVVLVRWWQRTDSTTPLSTRTRKDVCSAIEAWFSVFVVKEWARVATRLTYR